MSLEVTSHRLLVLFLATLCPEATVLQAYPAYPLRKRAFFFFFNVMAQLFFKNNFYLFLAVLGLCSCASFSLVAASGGSSLVAAHRMLIAVSPEQALGCWLL